MTSIIQKIEKGEFELWLHPKQKDGFFTSTVKGTELYQHLRDNNLLDACANEDDLKEIKKQGIEFYRKHFGNNYIFAWKSVVPVCDGDLLVPFLIETGDEGMLRWDSLGRDWVATEPALRFVSSQSSDTLPLELIINGVTYLRK